MPNEKKGLEPAELKAMSRDELVETKQEVDRNIADIKAQLGKARANKFETGEYADPTWYQSAKSAMRYKQLSSQAIQDELGRRRRKEKNRRRANGAHVNSIFMDLVFDVIGEAKFNELLRHAQVIADEEREAGA